MTTSSVEMRPGSSSDLERLLRGCASLVHEAAEREDRQQAQTKPPQSSALAPVDQ